MTDNTMKELAKLTKRIPLLLEQRDHLIYEAKKEGVPVTQIAATADLSRSQVHRILSWRERGTQPAHSTIPSGATMGGTISR